MSKHCLVWVFILSWHTASSWVGYYQSTSRLKHSQSRSIRPIISSSSSEMSSVADSNKTHSLSTKRKVYIFPGGGLFFWWQAGWVSAHDFSDTARMVGASAGALTAVTAKVFALNFLLYIARSDFYVLNFMAVWSRYGQSIHSSLESL
jgi:hypothetical protein